MSCALIQIIVLRILRSRSRQHPQAEQAASVTGWFHHVVMGGAGNQ